MTKSSVVYRHFGRTYIGTVNICIQYEHSGVHMDERMKPAIKISVRGLNLYYGSFHALKNISMDICQKEITALIGPSGCDPFLRTLNRMNDLAENVGLAGA